MDGHKDVQTAPPNSDKESTLVDQLNVHHAGAGQACKECWRRKARCDRAIPACSACMKYGRHCLYEKHSRSPLTRKHLTEVEERLERAERLLRQAQLKACLVSETQHVGPPESSSEQYTWHAQFEATRTGPSSGLHVDCQVFDFNTPISPIPTQDNSALATELPISTLNGKHVLPSGKTYDLSFHLGEDDNLPMSSRLDTFEDETHPYDTIDGPPVTADDFEWDEQDIQRLENSEYGQNSVDAFDTDREGSVVDGMGSLTIVEGDGGYLGIASGAALLRMIDPSALGTSSSQQRFNGLRAAMPSFGTETRSVPIYEQPNPSRHIADVMIESYFKHYNACYPVVHEPSFRAQYSEVIERPNGMSWRILAYIIAAIGAYASADIIDDTDLPLFEQARAMFHWNCVESGNLTLVQALSLMSNYLQKRNKPNSAFNCLGLASRMAMGIGLHKEFPSWNIRPLKMEIRRRVWWCLSVFDLGATITFGRPIVWPGGGIDVALPLNVHDQDITAASQQYPTSVNGITAYTAIRAYSSFYLSINHIYSRVISKPFATAKELLDLDDKYVAKWLAGLPSYFVEDAEIPTRHRTSFAIMIWKYRNFKIIMYRPYVIRQVVYACQACEKAPESIQAYKRCLYEARETILSIASFWDNQQRTRIGAWYSLYFLFQAALIPCLCLRNEPTSPDGNEWRSQIRMTLRLIESISTINLSGKRCYDVILGLCVLYLGDRVSNAVADNIPLEPINESPQTQMNNVYSMMWPDVPMLEVDNMLYDDAWMEFMGRESNLRT